MNTLTASFAQNGDKPMIAAAPSRPDRMSSRRASRREYLVVSAIAFPIFFVIVLFARLLPRSRRERLLGAFVDGNVFAQAKAMAATTIPYAFMG